MMDVSHTLLEIAGVLITHTIEGRSFLATLEGKQNNIELARTIYFTSRKGGMEYGVEHIT